MGWPLWNHFVANKERREYSFFLFLDGKTVIWYYIFKKRCEYRNLFFIIIIPTEYCWGRILSLDRMAYSDDHTTVATQQVFYISFGKLDGTMIPNQLKSRKWFHFPTYIIYTYQT